MQAQLEHFSRVFLESCGAQHSAYLHDGLELGDHLLDWGDTMPQ